MVQITSFDERGDAFLAGMYSYKQQQKTQQELFTEFISNNGFSAWHIHDGWVRHKYDAKDSLNYKYIDIVWWSNRKGFTHSGVYPSKGEKMVVVRKSPDKGLHSKEPFRIYCYNVLDDNLEYHATEVKLENYDVKWAIFNLQTNQYELYIPPPPFSFRKFFKKLFNL